MKHSMGFSLKEHKMHIKLHSSYFLENNFILNKFNYDCGATSHFVTQKHLEKRYEKYSFIPMFCTTGVWSAF